MIKKKPAGAPPETRKREWIVLLLAMLPGFCGFLGLGHLYLGKIRRGLILLVVGLVWAPALVLFVVGIGSVYFGRWTALILITGAVALLAGRFILWVWHTYDARRIYRETY